MAYRPFPAGPLTPVEGLQMLGGPIEAALRAVPSAATTPTPWPTTSSCLSRWSSARGAARGRRRGARRDQGAEVSAVRREAGLLEVRVFNPTDRATTVRVAGRSGWLVDLRGGRSGPSTGRSNCGRSGSPPSARHDT